MNIKSIKILSEEDRWDCSSAAAPQKEMYCIPVPTWISRKKQIVSDFLYMIIMRMRKAGILKKDWISAAAVSGCSRSNRCK